MYDPVPVNLWPQPERTLRPDLSPKTKMRPFCLKNVKGEPLPINVNLIASVIARRYKVLAYRYCLGEYRYRIAFWRQEPVPMLLPLFPTEHPLRTDGIGPSFTKVKSGVNHNTSTYLKL